nr:ribbon-helix-helix domain-containing protein [uncultured Methanoregula sp.]
MPVQETKMERTTISLPEKQLMKIDEMVSNGDYPNRSEGIRTAIREFIERHPNATGSVPA